jgi:hypothetical protein
MEIFNFITGVILPVYCLWRSSKDQEIIMGNTKSIVADCKEFVEKCLRRENGKQLEEIKQYFKQECKGEDVVKNVERIIELPKQSEDSMILLNSYLESEKFYSKVLKNLPSQ